MLCFQTTDENWKATVIKESVNVIYKMVKLDSLAVYWNSNMSSYLKEDRQQILVGTHVHDQAGTIEFHFFVS